MQPRNVGRSKSLGYLKNAYEFDRFSLPFNSNALLSKNYSYRLRNTQYFQFDQETFSFYIPCVEWTRCRVCRNYSVIHWERKYINDTPAHNDVDHDTVQIRTIRHCNKQTRAEPLLCQKSTRSGNRKYHWQRNTSLKPGRLNLMKRDGKRRNENCSQFVSRPAISLLNSAPPSPSGTK